MPLINVRKRKHELRARFKRFRAECPPELKKSLDKRLFERFVSLEEYLAADVLFAYISQPIECDTSAIITDALEKGKRVAVPKCHKTSNEMDFYFIKSYDDLSPGKYGILEPVPERCEKAVDFSRGLCLVPGLSFDLQGYRLGFGKGYYDRFLAGYTGRSVAIAYAEQETECVPTDPFDRRPDVILTDRERIV